MNPRQLAGALALGVTVFASRASARTVQDERYTPDVAWNAAVRLLRVDLGFTITERDHDAGFILFSYQDPSRAVSQGSLEIVPASIDGTVGCRVIVQLAQMPAYAEHHILTRLARKLIDEYGEPPPPPRHEPTHAPPPESTLEHDHDSDAEPAHDAPAHPHEPAHPTSGVAQTG